MMLDNNRLKIPEFYNDGLFETEEYLDIGKYNETQFEIRKKF